MTDVVLVALGSNLGDRAAYLASARNALALLRGTRLVAASAVEETAPFGWSAQGPYLNQMVALRTSIAPLPLLAELQRIERSLGRVRRARWGARTIDLDIVRHGERRATLATLTLPHPGIASRAFWQREIAQLDGLLAAAA
ncbi:MAG: 2-amino-4-hydroxy-6-hydroxymethyldihydropteridine pyrophosphokinae [Gemmatimonadetes bacterium]|jgi:2-amino-4-hydroxy-6-hydroxymethyldihydropteridine diphosphokinase|nr:2-amino-4-hydroxy-6-hydroxymethyldihydropteridine pyrophosphokinae [Gemmatimonadota bacterium]